MMQGVNKKKHAARDNNWEHPQKSTKKRVTQIKAISDILPKHKQHVEITSDFYGTGPVHSY
jgi:hypothetical protein